MDGRVATTVAAMVSSFGVMVLAPRSCSLASAHSKRDSDEG